MFLYEIDAIIYFGVDKLQFVVVDAVGGVVDAVVVVGAVGVVVGVSLYNLLLDTSLTNRALIANGLSPFLKTISTIF